VAGTINGVAATGIGQLLSAAITDMQAGGLVLKVTDVGGGTFEYAPGLAQRLVMVGNDATSTSTGQITTAISGHQRTIDRLGDQIADWDVRLAQRKQTLVRQFTDMEVALGKLKDQSSWLAGQLASLPSASGNG
jgi:flagellar hook-associated protein 2